MQIWDILATILNFCRHFGFKKQKIAKETFPGLVNVHLDLFYWYLQHCFNQDKKVSRIRRPSWKNGK